MASYEIHVKEERNRTFRGTVKTWIGWLGSLTLSLVGGLVLAWWELNYHPTNNQQWMVPLGLIFFVTPLFVCLAVLISDSCNSGATDPNNVSLTHNSPDDHNSPVKPFHDPER